MISARVHMISPRVQAWEKTRGLKRLHCHRCGSVVSTPVPSDAVVRGWIECPECIEKPAGITTTPASDRDASG